MGKSQKSRYWTNLIYPDSAPGNWINILIQTHLPISISPCHDRDIKNPLTGEMDKPHFHVLYCFDGPTTQANINRICQDELNGTVALQVYSVKGLYDYFVHPEDTCKVPYAESDRMNLNGFDIRNYTQLTSQEEIILVKQIKKYIRENQIIEYSELNDFLEEEDLQAFDYVIHHTIYFNTYLTSLRNKLKDAAKLKAAALKKVD